MSMGNKEALAAAFEEFLGCEDGPNESMETAIRAYLNARGLVMVPRVATQDMREAGGEWSILPEAVWSDMIDTSPDPFKDDTP